MDPSTQLLLSKNSSYNVDDTDRYFLKNLYRLRESDYMPSKEDFLKSRNPTSGAVDFLFYHKHYTFRLVHFLLQTNDFIGSST